MGVPSFYKWLVNKYPNVVGSATPNSNGVVEYDNFYLDMNSIIHPCFHPEDPNSSLPSTFEEVFRNMFDYIDRLVNTVKPRKLLYMAIDGVAPRAKMNQQRARRFRTAKDNEIREAEEERLRKKFEMEGKQVLPKQESEVSDPNIITPGTEFMHELSMALKNYFSSRIASDSLWKDIMVILSDANVPGEGEHKIMSYIRGQRNLPGYDPNTTHCLYGSDADLIMLALATHEPHFSILREDGLIQGQVPQNSAKPLFLHIWILREYLELDMKIQDPPKNCPIEFERIIDDFIFICFFAGNDFLPHMPTFEIREDAINLLMYVYKTQFSKLGGYLVDITRIGEKHAAFVKLSRVEKFILMVGAYEDKIFSKRSESRAKYLKKLITDHQRSEEQNAASFSDLDDGGTSDCAIIIKKAPATKNSSGFVVNEVSAPSAEILQNTKDLKVELDKCMKDKGDLFKSGEFRIDKIKLGTAGYKQRYYKEKFSVEGSIDFEKKRKDVVEKYTEGLLWVLQYYFSGVASWSWFYPYHYGPFASDLKGMGQVKANFEKGVPFSPFDQLLSVLPPRSAYALPKSYSKLMIDEDSKILHWYPQDFEVDTEGKRYMWQAICKLPWINERELLSETREIQNGLSQNEKIRNSVKVDSLFVRSSSNLSTKICSLSTDNNQSKLETNISDRIGGIISLCLEDVDVERPNLGMEICDKKQEDHALCVYYELPAGGSSTAMHHLLSGVNIPTKTIYESEIKETVLWHEKQMYQTHNRFERSIASSNATTPQNRRSFSLNAPPEVIYKGAGVGWGSGRGKPSNTPTMQRLNTMTNERVSPSLSPNHHHQSLQSQTMPFGRGRGRLGPNANNVNPWRRVDSSGSSYMPNQQVYQVKDHNRW
ncbi:5'-3' exoribonuclease 3-like isoform X2 [Lotus japonicus]|uniref:5'-3' exoribonuclease 3-like isoform X2 n=1 Tax=Lotus japonicus TaxID=34305 RepID=UPI00258A3632|nr:5'-3' exoribonuclease 3-like isoform X2 [Lotus japonicus]